MKDPETKQAKALCQLSTLRPNLLKLLLGAPDFGTVSLKIIFMDGSIKRIVHKCKETILPENNEYTVFH